MPINIIYYNRIYYTNITLIYAQIIYYINYRKCEGNNVLFPTVTLKKTKKSKIFAVFFLRISAFRRIFGEVQKQVVLLSGQNG